MKFRFHRGSLDDSLKTEVEINPPTLNALAVYLDVEQNDLTVTPYCFDERCGWDTHLVKTSDGVLGMTDMMPESNGSDQKTS